MRYRLALTEDLFLRALPLPLPAVSALLGVTCLWYSARQVVVVLLWQHSEYCGLYIVTDPYVMLTVAR